MSSTSVELRIDANGGGLDAIAGLERAGLATFTSLSLPPEIGYEAYLNVGAALGAAHRSVAWCLADWINFGERAYGEKYADAIEVTKLNEQTLMNYAYVGRKIPPDRRVPGIPFGVHAELASLDPPEQVAWLDKVKQNGWKRAELRAHLRPTPTGIIPVPTAGRETVEEAARELVTAAKHYGADYLVPKHRFEALCAALGVEQ